MRIGVIDGRATLINGTAGLDIAKASDGRFGPDPMSVFEAWADFTAWAGGVTVDGAEVDMSRLQNPVPAPRQVFVIGANYLDHIEEAGATPPTAPLIFTKFPSCLVGPGDPIPLPSRKVDWEVELVVVIGERAYRVPEADAWRHVAGLTVGQDVSERVVQLSGSNPQFSMGKSFPAFGPLGPVVVTPDEFDDPDDLELGCLVNDRLMQKSRTGNLIFPVAELIARISAVCPLLPGDLIFTGTPAGVGAFRSPRVFLRPGDELVSWVEGIGELRNPVIAGPDYVPSPQEARPASGSEKS